MCVTLRSIPIIGLFSWCKLLKIKFYELLKTIDSKFVVTVWSQQASRQRTKNEVNLPGSILPDANGCSEPACGSANLVSLVHILRIPYTQIIGEQYIQQPIATPGLKAEDVGCLRFNCADRISRHLEISG